MFVSRPAMTSLARRLAVLAAWFLVAGHVPLASAEWRFDVDSRVVAISDVHGDYDAMVATLNAAGVVDGDARWSGGDTHLVITGDLLDRGPDSRRVMDLVRSLETAAAADGGAVHLLLGNHEVMNLVGDLRYVADEEYAAFADDERPADRERWFQNYLAQLVGPVDEDEERRRWEALHPPGFFAHRRAFRSDGEYGRWLLSKPLIVIVNDTAFVHGGLSPRVAELGLEGVNGRLKADLERYVVQLDVLVDAGLLAPSAEFHAHPDLVAALEPPPDDAGVGAAIGAVHHLNASLLHAADSPLWYRGNVGCSAPVEVDRLDAVLTAIGAERVVVGHTPTASRQVLERLGGRVVEIDTGMLNDYYGGTGNALVIEDGELAVVGETGAASAVLTHPRRVGRRAPPLSSAELEQLLRDGEVTPLTEDRALGRIVTVTSDRASVTALFQPHGRRGFAPELAAYRLDRELELGMVPATVSRTVGGSAGTLQFLPEQRTNESARRESGRGGSAWCPLEQQWHAMYVFDTLVHNPGRAQEHMLYSPDNWQLLLTGHARSFGTRRGRPAYLEQVALAVGDYWRERLGELSDERIAALFDGILDSRRQRALAKRRDLLLAVQAQ